MEMDLQLHIGLIEYGVKTLEFIAQDDVNSEDLQSSSTLSHLLKWKMVKQIRKNIKTNRSFWNS